MSAAPVSGNAEAESAEASTRTTALKRRSRARRVETPETTPVPPAQTEATGETPSAGEDSAPIAISPSAAVGDSSDPSSETAAAPSPEPASEADAAVKRSRSRRRRSRARGEDGTPADSDSFSTTPDTRADEPIAESSAAENTRLETPAPEAAPEREDSGSEELPVPIWRPRKAPEAAPAPNPPPTVEEPNLAPRRRRDKRRFDRRDREISAAAAFVETPPPPPAPAPKPVVTVREVAPSPCCGPPRTRPVVPTPPDAPQVVMRDGIVTLVRDGRAYPPLIFFGSSPDERRFRNVMDEIRLAAERGVELFAHLVELTVDPGAVDDAVVFAGYLVKKTVEIKPDAQVLLRVVFVAPRGWQQKYPRAKYITAGGGTAEPSLCDDQFWGVAADCLRAFVKKLRLLGLDDNVLGLHLERGEWFFAEGWGYDTSVAAHDKFRDWIRLRYRDDVVALRAAWFDGDVQFQTVSVPEYRKEKLPGEEFVNTSRKARRWVDYHLFLSDVTVERIGALGQAVKEASDGRYLVGVSYGYTFEWSHPANGHLSLGKLLRTPEIDFIAGPPSYRNREPGGSAPFPGPVDSFTLSSKLYISEEDFKTPISGTQEPDDFNPVMRTPQALESVHWRGLGAALAHQSGVAWMDLWGNGWLSTSSIWQRGARAREVLTLRMAAPPRDPDVAVFIDERSLAYLVDEQAFRLLVQNVREAILRSGLSAGFYLLSDLAHRERFPESKLHVFMNAWDIRPEVRSAIKSRLQRDGKLLFWLYAAGLFEAGREALERVREVTGIALKPQPFASKPGTALLNRRHPLCEALPEQVLSSGGTLEPSYFAIPEDGLVLGEYVQTGLPSFVMREFHNEADPSLHWKSVFLGEPIVTPALFRALGQLAGAHVWNYQEDVVHVRPPFLTVHCTGTGTRTITLPDKWSAYDLLQRDWATIDATHLRFQAIDGTTHVFLVGDRADIETLLSVDPAQVLRVDSIPPKRENTISLDSVHFDVPIMRLDEWMEDGWNVEAFEEALLIPAPVEVEWEEETRPVSRRRRRRRGKNRPASEEPREESRTGGPESADDLGVNVLFRKRE